MSSIGERLRNLRKQRNMTQVEAAVAIGTSRSNLTKIETGEYLPGREVLMAAAEFYGVSLDWLTSGDKPNSKRSAVAENEQEALLLYAYRALPRDEAEPLLAMLLNRVKPPAH
ncbi:MULTISPECIES: helix-turn-helix domain-containing protein [Acetobacter]|nr:MULTISPECIES: helix-turn-helix transcriptional regulator [Acetobacter]WKC16724.1 helix-turn-helix transcriptional regulator [Acetobacter pasteurianus]